MRGALLGIASLMLVAGTAAWWFRLMQQVAIRGRRGLVQSAMGAGLAGALISLSWHPGWLGGVAAMLALLGSSLFLVLAGLSRQERRHPAVGVGDPMPAFESVDADSLPWSSGALTGRPYLLKFFRGHW